MLYLSYRRKGSYNTKLIRRVSINLTNVSVRKNEMEDGYVKTKNETFGS